MDIVFIKNLKSLELPDGYTCTIGNLQNNAMALYFFIGENLDYELSILFDPDGYFISEPTAEPSKYDLIQASIGWLNKVFKEHNHQKSEHKSR